MADISKQSKEGIPPRESREGSALPVAERDAAVHERAEDREFPEKTEPTADNEPNRSGSDYTARRSRPAPPATAAKDPVTAQIEELLADDLTDAYLRMSPDKQAEFKRVGEETATAIRKLLEKTKVSVKKIFELIRAWLKMIPGVNRYYLEQEAKIKTDKILRLRQ